jgi:hypothetical protein
MHDADKAHTDALEATNKAMTRSALGIKALPPEQRDFGYRAERSRLVTANPALASQIPEQYPGDSWIDSKINEGLNADQYLSNVRADAKAKLEAPGIQADTLTKQAEVLTRQAESEQKQRQVEASALAPALARGAVAYQQALAQMDPKRAALYAGFQTPRDLLMFASTPTEQITAQRAEATAAETGRQHAQQNAFEQARLALEKTKSVREENIYQQTYGTGANPALVGVDPKLRTQVTKEAQKVGDEYLKAQEAADQMQSLIELTRTGNKAAGSNLPLIGVETLNAINGIKRINKDEIKQYGGAGSLYDKIVGKLEGAAIGQPIPADVLKDIETMHNTLRQGAESSYKTRLQGINDNYKSNFQPVRTPGAATGKPPEITSQAAYDALPKGAKYTHKGEVLTKK